MAEILRTYGEAYKKTRGDRLSSAERKALRDLTACRTSALGGHAWECLDCGHVQVCYNSCRNRHCPTCGGPARAKWLTRLQEDLLPTHYFHLVFTLPHELSRLALANRREVYGLLFQAAWETLRDTAKDPQHLGAQVGAVMVLHTCPEAVLKYLARYVAGAAIGDSRLLTHEQGRVTFRVKDYRQGRKRDTLTLPGEEFVRRFCLHVLPKGLVRVRYFGLLAPTRRKQLVSTCRELLARQAPASLGDSPTEPLTLPVYADPTAPPRPCEVCGGERLTLLSEFGGFTWSKPAAQPPAPSGPAITPPCAGPAAAPPREDTS